MLMLTNPIYINPSSSVPPIRSSTVVADDWVCLQVEEQWACCINIHNTCNAVYFCAYVLSYFDKGN